MNTFPDGPVIAFFSSRFYSTASTFFTDKGTGLGLSLAYDIVTKGHAGTLEVESLEGESTTFIIRMPLSGSAPDKGPSA